jgi:hypothetical protein
MSENAAGSIKQFAIKICIAAVVISASTIFVVDWIVDTVEESVSRTAADLRGQLAVTGGGREFWAKIERELDRAADPASDLSPEKKQKLLDDVQVIVTRWRPFIDAVQTAAKSPPNPR